MSEDAPTASSPHHHQHHHRQHQSGSHPPAPVLSSAVQHYIRVKDLNPSCKSVFVKAIVLDKSEPQPVKDNHVMYNLLVADESAAINFTAYDIFGKEISLGDIIKIKDAYCTVHRNCMSLALNRKGRVEKIGDFTMVFKEDNISKIRWTQDPSNPDQWIADPSAMSVSTPTNLKRSTSGTGQPVPPPPPPSR